jgi:hypothetical protein
MHQSRPIHARDYIRHGPRAVLFGHLLVVHYLDRHIQRGMIVFTEFVYLDAMEGHLHEDAEKDLCQVIGER